MAIMNVPPSSTPSSTTTSTTSPPSPSHGPLPALALTKALDDLFWGRWDPWVATTALYAAAFAALITRDVLEGG